MTPARHPVPPVPHPGARRDQDDQQMPRGPAGPAAVRTSRPPRSPARRRPGARAACRPGPAPRRAEARAGSAAYAGGAPSGPRPRWPSVSRASCPRARARGRSVAQPAAAAQQRQRLVGGAQPGGDDRAPLRLVAVEQRLVRRRGARPGPASRRGCRRPAAPRPGPGCRARRAGGRRPRRGRPGRRASAGPAGGAAVWTPVSSSSYGGVVPPHQPARVSRMRATSSVGRDQVLAAAAAASPAATRRRAAGGR